ncbi:MAG: SRPBCC family protein [Bacteroidota bacterium]
MKIIKGLVFGILALIALLLIVALFVPKDYTVSVSETINQPKQVVFDYVKLIKNQENYSVWVMEDPNIAMTYTGEDGTLGFKAAWNSKDDNVGEGSQQITKITDDRVDVDLHFVRPMEGESKAATFVEAVSANKTKVTNEFYGHSDYPMNLMSLIGIKFIKESQTKNLANLKKIMEE